MTDPRRAVSDQRGQQRQPRPAPCRGRRKLRKVNDQVSSLSPSLRPCPFLAEDVEEPQAEDQTPQEVEKSAESEIWSLQNEPNATQDNAAGAIRDRAEYVPTPR